MAVFKPVCAVPIELVPVLVDILLELSKSGVQVFIAMAVQGILTREKIRTSL